MPTSDIPESAFAEAAQAYFDAGPVVPEVTVGALTRSPRLRAAVESAYRAGEQDMINSGWLVPEGSETREEWRVTGDPGQGYPPYDFTWPEERGARGFLSVYNRKPWPVGPDLTHRKVITTPWSPVPEEKP